ncbi:trace amine-associated receptor 13c-like [Alosa sapidissima]|uniref:trace amine-associated receptor 13c-like n=1 Tax=Alosa sapidissima TaxID=34773 RepID=UPI001C091A6A|nr:trace amine-associated receptor 13c-like [Alosa sapidissima]
MEFTESTNYSVVSYCFPSHNLSCLKVDRLTPEYISMYIFFALVSFFTVFSNLLVIISICYFKQLQTPTNLLILSLAVSDFMVGLVVIPIESIKLIESCWYFGKTFCSIFQATVFTLIFVSLYNLVLIAVDQYYAVCNPLLYCSKMTTTKTLIFIFLIWSYSLIYNLTLLYCNANLYRSQEDRICYGECTMVVSFTWGVVDLIVSFVGPCSVIIGIYMYILKVARRQEKLINIVLVRLQSSAKEPTMTKTSGRKATKTLGIVLFVFLTCWITHYICILSEDSISNPSLVIAFLVWVIYINSFLNPIIYVFRYTWFRASVKHILTLKILDPLSVYINITA